MQKKQKKQQVIIQMKKINIGKYIYGKYHISSNKRPWRLLSFEIVRCGTY